VGDLGLLLQHIVLMIILVMMHPEFWRITPQKKHSTCWCAQRCFGPCIE